MAKEKVCGVCGRKDRLVKGLCPKHRQQMDEHGFTLDNNQRCETDLNQIIIHEDYAEIVLYDKFQEELDDRVLIDLEDLDNIKNIRWNKRHNCIIGKVTNETVLLQNYILNTKYKVNFTDGDYFNFKKDNLEIVLPSRKRKKKQIVSKKNKGKIVIEFVGKSQTQVTGSAILISYPVSDTKCDKILVEFGQSQTNRDLYSEYLANKEIINSIPCDEIAACFINHTHLDHIGLLPALIPNGFDGDIITTIENKKLMQPLLLDGAYIMDRNITYLNTKKYKVEPLYTESDVYLTMNKTIIKDENITHRLNDYVSYKFVSAGHILGSCQLVLFIKTLSGNIKKIHISSDLGSEYNKQPFVKDRVQITSSNVSIVECTYNDLGRGFNSKKEVESERRKLKGLIKQQLNKDHRILIPCFAQSRTVNMMVFLYESFKDEDFNTPIYIDGKLSLELNNVYQDILQGKDKDYIKEVLSWDNFKYISNYEKSKLVALNKDKKIVISSGGMCTNGRILSHVKTMIEDSKSSIITCGYMGEGTIGREIQREDNTVIKIEGIEYKKKCKVFKMNTWSSHIMAMENIKSMSQIRTPLIILHHSSDEKIKFRDIVEQELRKRNNSAKVVCATEENNMFYV